MIAEAGPIRILAVYDHRSFAKGLRGSLLFFGPDFSRRIVEWGERSSSVDASSGRPLMDLQCRK